MSSQSSITGPFAVPAPEPEAAPVRRARPSRARQLSGDPKLWIGLVLGAAILLMALLAPFISGHDPLNQDLLARLGRPSWMSGGKPSYILGADGLGRDVWARIAYGARASLLVGVAATVVATLFGTALGMVAGFYGSWIDKLLMRLTDIQMAFPSILLALAIMVMLGAGLGNLIIVLGAANWVLFARVIRAEVLSLREREFIQASIALGATGPRLLVKHLLPNVFGSVMILATVTLARVVIAEASLSFLGLGIPPPNPSWGNMLADGRQYLAIAWWASTFPGLALMATVIAVNLLGDWLRDVLDPRLQARRSEITS
jgi:peptide/nickel transport system permease protein